MNVRRHASDAASDVDQSPTSHDVATSPPSIHVEIFFSDKRSNTVRPSRVALVGSVGLGLGLIIPTSRKSRSASYLAVRHIWHDTGTEVM